MKSSDGNPLDVIGASTSDRRLDGDANALDVCDVADKVPAAFGPNFHRLADGQGRVGPERPVQPDGDVEVEG